MLTITNEINQEKAIFAQTHYPIGHFFSNVGGFLIVKYLVHH